MLARVPKRSFASLPKPSFLERFLYDAPSQNPLNEEFPGVPSTAGNKAPVPTAVKLTRLSNGVSVASQDNGSAASSVGVYVKAGSRFETTPGTTAVLQKMAFSSTHKRSTAKLQRDAEDMGAVLGATATRETFAYTAEALRGEVAGVTELLAEVATQPKLRYWDVNETKEAMAEDMAAAEADPASLIVKGIHAAAYGATSALGHTVDAAALEGVDAEAVKAFLGARFTGKNTVIVGTNVEHEKLVDVADKFFLSLPESAATPAAEAVAPAFLGGEAAYRAASGAAHVAIALPAPSLADAKNVAAVGVLQALLGSTGSHGAAGAPRVGPARQSRIARSVHTESHSFIHSLAAFSCTYSDAGMFGLVGSAADGEAGRLVDAMAGFLKDAAGVAATGPELERAKKAFKLSLLAQLDTRAGLRGDIGTQLALTGSYTTASKLLAAVDALTAGDVAGVAKAALAAGTPAITSVGSLTTVPRYDVFASLLK